VEAKAATSDRKPYVKYKGRTVASRGSAIIRAPHFRAIHIAQRT
jgi:hypothetical protein